MKKQKKSFSILLEESKDEARRKIMRKIPSWNGIEGIELPSSLSIEQCSSEATAIFKASLAKEILKGISIETRDKELVGIIGPNGSGKSTLLKCIYRVLKADSGAVYLDGEELYSMNAKSSARKMAVVAQHNYYNFDFSGYDGAVSHKIIEQMTEKSARYLRAVENNDKSYIMSITAPDYYTSVIPDEYMGRKISDISEASVSIRNSDGNTIYEIDFRLKFSDDAAVSSESYDTGQIQDNDIDFIIIMDKDNSGSMIITAVYYTDMQKGLNDE